MAERTCRICLKKFTHSVIFSNLNCWGIVLSVYVDILCSKGQTDRFLWQKWIPDVFIDFRSPLLCPSPGHNYGVSILSSINFCKTFLRLTRVRKIAKTWNSAKLISYLSLIISPILDCFYPVVLMLFFRCVTVKTSNINIYKLLIEDAKIIGTLWIFTKTSTLTKL